MRWFHMSEDEIEYVYVVKRFEIHDGQWIVAVFKTQELADNYIEDCDKKVEDITRTWHSYTRYEVRTE